MAQVEGSGTEDETSTDTPPELSAKNVSKTENFTAVGAASVKVIGPTNCEYDAGSIRSEEADAVTSWFGASAL
jgi:hypothetical protein